MKWEVENFQELLRMKNSHSTHEKRRQGEGRMSSNF